MYRLIKEWYMKEKKVLTLSIICGFVFTFIVAFMTYAYSASMQREIAEQVIRLHVKANSDSEADQNLKVTVRDRVLERFRYGLEAAGSVNETESFIVANLEEIRKFAQEVVYENGYDYNVTAELTNEYFPTKNYANVALPAGNYEALRINIGNAEGSNWWCVMFPPLCYVDITQKVIPEKEDAQLRKVLTTETYNLVAKHDKPEVAVKFKIVEWWQELMR